MSDYDDMDKRTIRNLRRRINRARRFPHNTDASCRHVQTMGETLAAKKPYPMLTEEPLHCAVSLLSTVLSLYEARNELEKLRAAMEPGKG